MKQKSLKIDFRYLCGNIACLSVNSMSGEPVCNDINNEEAIIIFNSLVGEKENCQTVKKILKENQQLKEQLEKERKARKEIIGYINNNSLEVSTKEYGSLVVINSEDLLETLKEEKKEKLNINKKFEFYIPESEIIPTRLRLKNDKIHIYYRRLEDKFGYEFDMYDLDNKEQGEDIIKEAANIMCNQSYDHGQEWRIVSIDCIKFNNNPWGKSGKWQVEFRIKDNY